MWGISILADFDLWGVSFHDAVVFGLGKNFLSKSTLGHGENAQKIRENVGVDKKKVLT